MHGRVDMMVSTESGLRVAEEPGSCLTCPASGLKMEHIQIKIPNSNTGIVRKRFELTWQVGSVQAHDLAILVSTYTETTMNRLVYK